MAKTLKSTDHALSLAGGSATVLWEVVTTETSDATPVTVATIAVPASGSIQIDVNVKGVQSDGSNNFSQKCTNDAVRSGSNAPTLSAGATGTIYAANANTFAVTKPLFSFVISGNNVLLQPTGKTATSINWTVEYSYISR